MASLVASVLAVGFGVQTAPDAAADTPAGVVPFTCPVSRPFVGTGDPTQLAGEVQIAGGQQFENIGTATTRYNAMGYSEPDRVIYAVTNGLGDQVSGELIAIGADGAVTNFGLIDSSILSGQALIDWNLDVKHYLNAGVIDPTDNTLWISNQSYWGWAGLYQIDVVNNKIIDYTPSIPEADRHNPSLQTNDFAYKDGFLWGISNDGTNMLRFSLPSGTKDVFPLNGLVPSGGYWTDQYGAAWTYGNNNLGFNKNTGQFYQIKVNDPTGVSPTFELIANGTAPAHDNNDGTSCTSVPTDLSIVKTGPAVVQPNGQVIWQLKVTNEGPGISSGFIVNDVVPANFTSVSTPTTGCTVAGNTVNCVGAEIEVGASTIVEIVATAPATGCGVNQATVLGNEEETNPDNNSSQIETCVGELNLAKTAGAVTGPDANGLYTATYTVTASNIGTSANSYGPIVDTPAFSSNLTVTGLSWNGNGLTGSETGPGPYSIGVANTAIAAGETHTYNLSITFRFNDGNAATACNATPGNGLYNSVTTNGETATTDDNNACIEPPPPPAASMSLVKSVSDAAPGGNGNNIAELGENLSYSFEVTNTGPLTLTNVAVTNDSFTKGGNGTLSAITCPQTTLAPGASTICTASYSSVTQSDIDAGGIDNTASASATDSLGGAVNSNLSTASIPVASNASIALVKSVTDAAPGGNANNIAELGETLSYSFEITNTGAVTLTNVGVSNDSFTKGGAGTLSAITCAVTTLAPGASTVCSAEYTTVTQSDVDAGSIDNTATASGTDPAGGAVNSDPSTATIPTPATSTISLVKTVSDAAPGGNGNGVADLGETLTYSFAVTNTGSVTLTNVAVTNDSFTKGGNGTLGAITCPQTTLAPGASTTCTATYATVTQSDIDAGGIDNTATASATNPAGGAVNSNPSTATIPVPSDTGLTLVKTVNDDAPGGNGNGNADLGETLNYSFTLTNAGNVTLTNVAVTNDSFTKGGAGTLSAISCPQTTLAPGASTTCTATYATVTQSDIDAGGIDNTASASGTDPSGNTVNSNQDTATIPVTSTATMSLVKSVSDATPGGDGDGVAEVGENLSYSFEVTNTGNVTLTNVAVTNDSFTKGGAGTLGTITCPQTTLAPGASTTCTATYTSVTQSDVDAGGIDNTATASGNDPSGANVTSNPSTATIPVPSGTGLALVKTVSDAAPGGNGNNIADLGETLSYSFAVTNTGSVTLTALNITDTFTRGGGGSLSAITCPTTTLAPGDSTTCSATYTSVTQSDVDAGGVDNKATASANDPAGNPVTSNEDTAAIPTASDAALTIAKTVSDAAPGGNANGVADLGETLSYSFVVTNSGSVTVNGITVADTFTRGGGGTLSAITCETTTLAPGASTTCTATYATVTQSDVDAGGIDNKASASGTTPGGDPVNSNEDTATIPTPGDAALSLEKTVSDAAPGGNDNNIADLGETLAYSFKLTNTGNVTLTNVAVTNDSFTKGGAGTLSAISCPQTTLAPGASTTCTATYATVTQSDIDAGGIDNKASATGTDPNGTAVPSNEDTASIPTPSTTGLALVKSVSDAAPGGNANGVADVGETLSYSFALTNTGVLTLTNVAVTNDSFTKGGAGTLSAITCEATTLAPGASTTCTATYATVTQSDVDAGGIDNTASASGTDPAGNPVNSNESTASIPVPTNASLTLVKGVSDAAPGGNANGVADLGETLTYTFGLTNNGAVSLTNVAVTNDTFTKGGAGTLSAITCEATTLAPGASTTCTATYATVTQSDVDAGGIDNTATASGTTSGGTPVNSNESTASIPTPTDSGLTLVKSVSDAAPGGNANGVADLGETLSYSFALTNSGSVTLTNVAVTNDSFTKGGAGTLSAITCAETTLAPGASTTCTATYDAVTQSDVDAGGIDNTASASGTDPAGNPVNSNESTASIPVPTNATLTLVKSVSDAAPGGNANGVADLGETLSYSFALTNSGSVTLTNVAVTNDSFTKGGAGTLSAITCEATTLAPGASTTCTATYDAVTQSDVDAGGIDNTASASGTDPAGNPVNSNESTASIPTPTNTGLTLVKSVSDAAPGGNANGVADLGETLSYSFALTNTGSVTLTNVAVTNDSFTKGGAGTLSAITCEATTLAPGASTTCTATYDAVTQSDVDAGGIDNTASASGNDPAGNPVNSNESTASIPVPTNATLTLVKSVSDAAPGGNGNGRADLGETLSYSFALTNSGAVTLTNVAVTNDSFTKGGAGTLSAITCAETTLAPGESTTCTATYDAVTQSDVDAGGIDNTASASGTDPAGNPVNSNESTATIPTPDTATLTLVKSVSDAAPGGNGNGIADLGETLSYSFALTNSGSVTLTNVAVTNDSFTKGGAGTLSDITCEATTLAPGASTTCTATYTSVTQSDVDAGGIDNAASATGTTPAGTPVNSNESTATIPTSTSTGLTLVKSVSDAAPGGNGNGIADLGETLSYSFALTNSGAVTLTNVAVTNDSFTKGGAGTLSDITCEATTLAPGASTTCTATYTSVTQSDVDAGGIDNTASASGTDPAGNPVNSNESTATIPTPDTATLTLVKSVSDAAPGGNGNGIADLGETLSYSFALTNSGAVTLTNVAVTNDSFTKGGAGTLSAITCAETTLAPGASTTCTATYDAVTQSDVDAGGIDNTASATGTTPAGTPVNSNESTASIPVPSETGLTLVKSVSDAAPGGNGNGIADLGETLSYSFALTNNGALTLTNVAVTNDSFTKGGAGTLSDITCEATTLAPGASTTCTATYTSVTQSDVDAGGIDNTASASGTTPGGNPVNSNESTATIPTPDTATLTLVKSVSDAAPGGNGNGVADLGETLSYSFALTNSGSVTLTNVAVTNDTFTKGGAGTLSDITCEATTLAPGASTTCSATYATVTQSDVDAGGIDNTASASATNPAGDPVNSNESTATIPTPTSTGLTLLKSVSDAAPGGNGNGIADLGETLSYSFALTNSGAVTLTNVAVTNDSFTKGGAGTLSDITCAETTLAPGASTTCTATYDAVTQSDVDAGGIDNTASASGNDPAGNPVNSNESTASIPVPTDATLTLVKSVSDAAPGGNGDGLAGLGETLSYSFALTNSGAVTLTNVAVTNDTFTKGGAGTLSDITCEATTLAPGESTTCTATYTSVTQSDVDAGGIDNTASATATDPTGTPVNSNESTATIPVPTNSSLTLVKSVSDAAPGGNGNGIADLGETLSYSFALTNSGSVTLTNVAVTNDTFTKGGAGTLSDITCAETTLAPGESTTCTATYTSVTQSDVDAGGIDNTASASATNPAGDPVNSNESTATIPTPNNTGLTLLKSVSDAAPGGNGDGVADLGETLSYSFALTNSGAVTLTNVAVTNDTFTKGGAGTLSDITCAETTLAPGESTTCTATYTSVTQSDVDAGGIDNTASASATNPAGDPVNSNESTATIPTANTATLSIVKTVSDAAPGGNGDGTADLGETLSYSFEVTNTGAVTITDVKVVDDSFTRGGAGTLSAITCAETTLAPGASTTCTATYDAVTQSDVDAGGIDNTASATGNNPSGDPVTAPPSTATIPTPTNSGLTLVKSVSDPAPGGNDNSTADLGETLNYSFKLTNTGSVTLTNVAVTNDNFTRGGAGTLSDISCPETTLAPGESTTCSATYTSVTQSDVDAGGIDNTASASATNPAGDPVNSNESTATIPTTNTATLSVVKTVADTAPGGNGNGIADLGETLSYSFEVTNTGAVTLTGVKVVDDSFTKGGNGTLSAITCPKTTLAPGESTTCSATYDAVTQEDVDAGSIDNTASATGNNPSGDPVTAPPSTATIPAPNTTGLTVVKTVADTAPGGNGNGIADLGETLSYSFEVTNTGSVTLTSVSITDDSFTRGGGGTLSTITCPESVLAPNGKMTCSATYDAVTQSDVDAGGIDNTASATGTDPSGNPVTAPPSTATIPTPTEATLDLVKSVNDDAPGGNGDGRADLGETLNYSFEVTNTGSVTITNVSVNNDNFTTGGNGALSDITCPETTLAPGASTTCTATYSPVTQGDVDGSEIVNTATATGTDPSGDPVDTPDSTATIPTANEPGLEIVKSVADTAPGGNGDGVADLGETLTYSFAITNTGDVTLTNVAVTNDSFTRGGTGSLGTITCPQTTLQPGASTTCTAEYSVVTQADVDAGGIDNTASATANDPSGNPVTAPPSTATIPTPSNATLQLVKRVSDEAPGGNANGAAELGETLNYTFEITNTGAVTITDVKVSNDSFTKGGNGTLSDITCAETTLAPGATTTCSATYDAVTQADVDAGEIVNTATASGTDPSGDPVDSPESTATIPTPTGVDLVLVKSVGDIVDVNKNALNDQGDTITYKFKVTNTGEVTLRNVAIKDAKLEGAQVAITCPATPLAPGESLECTSAAYTITEADQQAGKVHNVATATGTPPSGEPVETPESSTDTPVATPDPKLVVVKSVSDEAPGGNANNIAELGEILTYTFKVENIGNVKVTNIKINDNFTNGGYGTLSEISCPKTTLAVGTSMTCSATYDAVTQADVDAGQITNVATATGEDPSGEPVTSPPSTATVPTPSEGAIQLIKSITRVEDTNENGRVDAGDTVVYAFAVTNVGVVTLSDVTVTDQNPDVVMSGDPIATLAPNETDATTYTGTYVITQTDVNNGGIKNTAIAEGTTPDGVKVDDVSDTGTNPDGTPVDDPHSVETPDPVGESTNDDDPTNDWTVYEITRTASVELDKKVIETTDVNNNGLTDAGDTIQYGFDVTNTGSVTLVEVSLQDPMLSDVSCPKTTLAPAESMVCTAALYTITAEDEEAGQVLNTATVTSTTDNCPDCGDPTSTDTTDTPVVKPVAAIDLQKTSERPGPYVLNENVKYIFTVTNTGNIALTDVTVDDPMLGGVVCTIPSLVPGQSSECTARYTVTNTDVRNGSIENVATATGDDGDDDPTNNPVSEDTHDVPTRPTVFVFPDDPTPTPDPTPEPTPEPAEEEPDTVFSKLAHTGSQVAVGVTLASALFIAGGAVVIGVRRRSEDEVDFD